MPIPHWPVLAPVTLDMRDELHPLFQKLAEGISALSFANVYLFRHGHDTAVTRLDDERYLLTGHDEDRSWFLLPFGLPEAPLLDECLARFGQLRALTEEQGQSCHALGHLVEEDRANWDYLYGREDLVQLSGRKFHKKKNLLHAFVRSWDCKGRPLLDEYLPDALKILDRWRESRDDDGDYLAAREALELMNPLQLCGGIYSVNDEPVAYSLGLELARGRSFDIKFEKAVSPEIYKGIYQFVNQAFASILPPCYETINREQDLGDPGLRQAKESYRPVGHVKRWTARRR